MPGFVNPGDMREMKRIAKEMGVAYTMLPDTSGVMDAPMTGTFELYPREAPRWKRSSVLVIPIKQLLLVSLPAKCQPKLYQKMQCSLPVIILTYRHWQNRRICHGSSGIYEKGGALFPRGREGTIGGCVN